LSCTYVLNCNRGNNKPSYDDDDDDEIMMQRLMAAVFHWNKNPEATRSSVVIIL